MAARHVLFLYGSQTGNAEHIAKGVADQAKDAGYSVRCAALEDYEAAGFTSAEPLVLVVVCSSTGDGDPPDNALKFAKFLKKKTHPRDLLSKVRYAALCLGDTNYENFCGGGKKISQGLKDLGATEFYPRGLADDGTNLDSVVEPWIENLWPSLKKAVDTLPASTTTSAPAATAAATPAPVEPMAATATTTVPTTTVAEDGVDEVAFRMSFASVRTLKLPAGPVAEPDPATLPRLAAPKLRITLQSMATDAPTRPLASSLSMATAAQPALATVVSAECLTQPDAVKRTLALAFALPLSADETYSPGDAVGVCCPNDDTMVDALLGRLRLNGATSLSIAPIDSDPVGTHLAHAHTVRDLFSRSLDVLSFPKKSFFRAIAPHATVPAERNLLLHLSSRTGAKDYTDLRAQAPSLLDVLAIAPSCSPPLDVLCDQLLPLQPRYYSVASSPLARTHERNHATVAFNVVHYKDANGTERHGLCTTWFDRQVRQSPPITRADGKVPVSFSLPVFLRRATDFVLPPKDAPVPLVMIGPGTGVAPYLGFLEEWRERRQSSAALPETWLFYGCRDPAKDFLFEKELESFVSDGTLTHLHVSCSRVAPPKTTMFKGYVQAALIARAVPLAKLLLEREARIYVCGDAANMAREVHTALESVLVQGASIADTAARTLLQQWRESRRYVQDVWG